MRALWLDERDLEFSSNVPQPQPADREARVRVLMAGICNTDLELTRGYYPFRGIPGHEFVGVVESGSPALLGRRVVGEINAACGGCGECGAGRPTHCERRNVLGIIDRNGAFAEFLSLPESNLHVVPDEIPNERAVFCEPLAAALEIREQVPIGTRDRVLVVGDGKLGQLVAQTVALTGCELVVLGRHPRKLAILERRGITSITDASIIEPRRFDVAIECTGNPSGFDIARRALRPRGTLVMKSTYAGSLTLDASRIVVDEITLIGSRCGPFAPALELLRENRVDVESLIDARYPLEQGVEAFTHAAQKGTLKVLLEVSDE